MRYYLTLLDSQGRTRCGSDWGAVRSDLKTDRGALRWARALVEYRARYQDVGKATLEVCSDARPYGKPLRVLEVR